MSGNHSTVTEPALEQLSAMVVAAFASGLALLIFVVIQLLYRSTTRHRRLITAQRRLRFDASYLAAKGGELGESLKADARRARELREAILASPPQKTKRVVPTIHDMRDARSDCKRMLAELRTALGSTFAAASIMTMRQALQCIQGVLDPRDVERFSVIFEAVLFGVHRADGTVGDVSVEDLKFLQTYFGAVMKEL